MRLSIIVPIYNVEAFIPRCLESIYSQGIDEKDFEVIAINDGSPDNSSTVVKKYIEKHQNLFLIEQKNAGVSCARNNGIKAANGEYLLFVDPDDTIMMGSLPKIMAKVSEGHSFDIIVCRSFDDTKEFYKWDHLFIENTHYTANHLLNSGYLRGSVCGALYNRSFILSNGIHFIDGMRNGEDTNFNMQVLYYSSLICFSNIDLYMVIGRDGSASRLFSKKRIDIMIESVKTISEFTFNLSHKSGNSIVLPYMVYSPLSNLVYDTLKTPGVNLLYLLRNNISSKLMYPNLKDVIFLKGKMALLKTSFVFFYYLCWLKNIL